MGLAVALSAVSMVSNSAGGATLVAIFTLAVHRPFRYVAWVAGASCALIPFFFWIRPDPDSPYIFSVAFTIVLTITVVGWGMFVRSRRQLLLSLRDRARRAETEAGLRAEQAQRLAREAIAREMHDVLAHRLTLLSVHAGALEFRPDAPQRGRSPARPASSARAPTRRSRTCARSSASCGPTTTARSRGGPSRRWPRSTPSSPSRARPV
jgi:signal transduction histidine kinase